jgi:hypothetical protein
MEATNEPRYYVHDRGATQSSQLTNFSFINPRYWVMDRETGLAVDELTTKKEATEWAKMFNAGHPTGN